jgi:hypothetical protein
MQVVGAPQPAGPFCPQSGLAVLGPCVVPASGISLEKLCERRSAELQDRPWGLGREHDRRCDRPAARQYRTRRRRTADLLRDDRRTM